MSLLTNSPSPFPTESLPSSTAPIPQSKPTTVPGSEQWNLDSMPKTTPSPNIPLVNNNNKPLPHNGLFIRRNNEFGTRLNVGIKDLIEQGVLFEQRNIRFDDFIALNSEGIPLPKSGNSLAVSYGITPIPRKQKRNQKATHYLEIALKTSDIAPAEYQKSESPPVNYIFVIDTSSSMKGEKLDAVKLSIKEIFKSLKKDDVIGIIEFNEQPKTVLKATPVSKIDINKFSRIISGITANGGTDINIGISYGIDEISRYESNNTLNHIYLFSDGNPSSGETEWIRIRQNIDKKTRGSVRLSTFAFGSDANTRELDALAGLTGGKSTFVIEPNDIKVSLKDELNRREYLAAINVQLKIDIDPNIPIIYLYGHDEIKDKPTRRAVLKNLRKAKEKAEREVGVKSEPDLITQEKGIRIFVPDLAVGETYWIVFELAISEPNNLNSIGEATVQYVDTFKRQNQKRQLTLSPSGNLPSDLVTEHALGLWTSEVAFYILDDLYESDLETAEKRIENHITVLKSANYYLDSEPIEDDVITLRKLLSLAQNLGKVGTSSDTYPQQRQDFFIFSVSDFGRVRNGFNRNSSAAATNVSNP
ncbi:MAG: VWA domain-containing protein [Trichodesmium sp. MO_231.B1]|nr:VWA domain-containing protein [Trichodesmium sp. MO_231.B1]